MCSVLALCEHSEQSRVVVSTSASLTHRVEGREGRTSSDTSVMTVPLRRWLLVVWMRPRRPARCR